MENTNKLPNQEGRIMVVTGGNSGLGYETTLALARKGAKVIMACRSMAKANRAKEKIQQQVPNAESEVMEIDLSSLKSVRKFATAYQANYQTLDVLINNAGVMAPPYSKTEDGFELQLGANYFGPIGFKEMKGKAGKATATDLSKDEALAKQLCEKSEKLVGFKYL